MPRLQDGMNPNYRRIRVLSSQDSTSAMKANFLSPSVSPCAKQLPIPGLIERKDSICHFKVAVGRTEEAGKLFDQCDRFGLRKGVGVPFRPELCRSPGRKLAELFNLAPVSKASDSGTLVSSRLLWIELPPPNRLRHFDLGWPLLRP